MEVTVDAIGARLGNYVQDETTRLAILRVVVIGEDLKFLDFVHRGPKRIAHGANLVGNVAAVYVVLVAVVVKGTGTDQVGVVASVVVVDAGSGQRQTGIIVHVAIDSRDTRHIEGRSCGETGHVGLVHYG